MLPATRHILIVDDDYAIREALAEMLSDKGYAVSLAATGAEAVRYMERGGERPDVILLDLHMPEMNGWEFRIEQRKHPTWTEIPVVILSAEVSAYAKAIDAQGFLEKPVSAEKLTRTVADLIAATERERMARAEKLASLGMLAAGVAHEINNPLAFMLSNLNFAVEELSRIEPAVGAEARVTLGEVREALSESAEGGERVRTLVADLRRFARSEREVRQPLDVCEVVRLAARMANHALREKAELALKLAPTPHVLGDDSKLGQVFLNLLVNAAQAFPERRTQGNKIEVTTSMDDRGQVLVEIRDNGSGIAPASLPRIFDPFFTTKPVGEGTGLGLTICQQLIADHGGQISVRSELGKGTVFRVELPPVPA